MSDQTKPDEANEHMMTELRIIYMTARWLGSWGAGRTIEEARQNCRENAGLKAYGAHIVYLVPEGIEKAWVDGMGQICWSFPEGTDPEKR